ncbi:hypothetical protein HJ588_14185 [Flexivirga sp. ID2601S]|uniref:Uncharacterized protein n=1 Tax=Flexivirga aerilata TaxID=1656889 RepID=A0A849AJ07_9MICO|nr:hypothetical protein [Flexivirga aerilata]NNG40415.1 hypothetical protein [Flexivirga aerilata]
MKSSLVNLAAESTVPKLEENHLPMPHIVYGIIAMGVFLALLGLLWSFRNTAAKTASADGKSEH